MPNCRLRWRAGSHSSSASKRRPLAISVCVSAEPIADAQRQRRQLPSAQFSTCSPGTRENSRGLLVTSVTPSAWAWAAIWVS